MKRAAGYVRISQVGARSGDSFLSPEIQRERIEAWASYRGFEVVEWYTDLDRPAKEGDPRPEFERMMADAATGKFQAVAVYRLARFARSVRDAADRYSELRRHGVGLASVTEDIDSTTAGGELIQNMLFALAQFESKRIGEEWASVHAARRQRGIAHVTRRMFGYEIANGTLGAVIPQEAEAVRQVFQRRHAGSSYRELADWLERNGFRPRDGGRRFGQTGVAHILQNEKYAGLVRHNGELLPAQHDAIITPDEWRAVNALRSHHNQQARFRVGLLSGLLVCGSCGYRMSHNAGQPKAQYRCAGRYHTRGCPKPTSILARVADPEVEQRVLARLDPERMPNRGRIRQRSAGYEREAREAARRVDDLNRRLDALADKAGVFGAEEYERQVARLLSEREDARARADEAAALAATAAPVDVDAVGIWPSLSLRAKQRLLRTQLERVVVHPHVPGWPARERLELRWL